jgi:hypothetical protein
VSDRLVRFPGSSWQEVDALPQPLRWTVQRTIFQLLDGPVPALADPFPRDDPMPGAYELHLPADGVTIWYTVTEHEGQEVISVQHVASTRDIVGFGPAAGTGAAATANPLAASGFAGKSLVRLRTGSHGSLSLDESVAVGGSGPSDGAMPGSPPISSNSWSPALKIRKVALSEISTGTTSPGPRN